VIAKRGFAAYLARLREAASVADPAGGLSAVAPAAVPEDELHHRHRRASSYPSGRGPSYAGLSFIARTRNPDGVPVSVAADLAWPGEVADPGLGGGEAVTVDVGAADMALVPEPTARVSERCLEVLAVSLIRHLGSAAGHEEGVAPQVATVAGLLLGDLLDSCRPVYWSRMCMDALLSESQWGRGTLRVVTASRAPGNASHGGPCPRPLRHAHGRLAAVPLHSPSAPRLLP
jgi:hypothetical protein